MTRRSFFFFFFFIPRYKIFQTIIRSKSTYFELNLTLNNLVKNAIEILRFILSIFSVAGITYQICHIPFFPPLLLIYSLEKANAQV